MLVDRIAVSGAAKERRARYPLHAIVSVLEHFLKSDYN